MKNKEQEKAPAAPSAENSGSGESMPEEIKGKLAEYESKVFELTRKISEMESNQKDLSIKKAFKELLAGYNLESKAEVLLKLLPEQELRLDKEGRLKDGEKIITKLKEKLPELFSPGKTPDIHPALSRAPQKAPYPSKPKTLTFEEVRKLAAQKYKMLKMK